MTSRRSLQHALIALLITLIGVALVLLIARPWESPVNAVNVTAQSLQAETIAAQSEEMPAAEEPLEFTIAAAGDMLIHRPVDDSAWTGTEWDFSALMEPIAPYIQGADLALCHLEVPMVPRGQEPSGFPLFGAPQDLAASMANTGWDGCSTASNHSLDQGLEGIGNTLNFLDEVGMGHAGTARTEAESLEPQVYQIKGNGQTVTIAHIAAAHNLNGMELPWDAPWAVQMIDVPVLEEMARQAREDGADIVVASVHCCEAEYVTDPEPFQVEVAEELAASGLVDIYLAHHAHVPKTVDFLEGGPNGNGMWVAYGLGNFISNQQESLLGQKMSSSGLMTFFNGIAEEGQPPRIEGAEWLTVTMDFPAGHRVRPLTAAGSEGSYESPEELAARREIMLQIMEGTPATEMMAPPESGSNVTTVVPRG